MKKITVRTLIIMGIHLGIYLVLLIGGGSVSGPRILLFTALSFVGTFGIQFLLFREQEKMNQQTKRSLQAFNEGNFVVEVEEQYHNSFYREINDQLIDLKQMLNQWVYQLLTSSVSVKNSADRIYRFSENTKQSMYEMSMATQEIAKFFEDMADRLNQVSNAVTVLNDTSTKIAYNTDKAKSQVNQANLDADEGGQAVAIMSESMQKICREVTNAQQTVVELGSITDRIQSITESITAISSQTNLLALNASIEAARAGEHGKGFSVVAQEVRKLAEESRSSAEKINNLVVDVRNAVQNTKESMEVVEADVNHGVGVTGQAISSFEKIKVNVNKAATLMVDIAKDIAEQSEKTTTISQNTVELADLGQIGTANAEELSATTQNQLESIEENHRSTDQMMKIAENLEAVMQQFDLSIGNQMLAACEDLADLDTIHHYTNQELKVLCQKAGLSEIHIINQEGVIERTSNESILGFTFSKEPGSQTYDFMRIIDEPSLKVNQKSSFRDVDGKLFKYTGIAMRDHKGIIQCGLEASRVGEFKGSIK